MILNSSGIGDIGRVLKLSTHTVIKTIKKTASRLIKANWKKLLSRFNIKLYFTDSLGAYHRQPDKNKHIEGKMFTQRVEVKFLTLRTRIKRLARKTICFSKSEMMHDTIIGLFINRYEFGREV